MHGPRIRIGSLSAAVQPPATNKKICRCTENNKEATSGYIQTSLRLQNASAIAVVSKYPVVKKRVSDAKNPNAKSLIKPKPLAPLDKDKMINSKLSRNASHAVSRIHTVIRVTIIVTALYLQ
jgi:hypothetical protein